MVKDRFIMLRVDDETKRRITEAAERRARSVTTFIVDTVTREAERVLREEPRPARVFRGVPSFFRASCEEAARGGAQGYRTAAFNLALHLHDLIEGADEHDRRAKLETLRSLLDEENEDPVLTWFELEFPKCLALVPPRRRRQFVEGIRAAADDERLEF
jgi:hypothetical protein